MASLPNYSGSPKAFFSASSLGKFRFCGMAGYYRYVAKAPKRPPGYAAVFGLSMHRTIQLHMEHAAMCGVWLPRADLREFFHYRLKTGLDTAIFGSTEMKEFGSEALAKQGLLKHGHNIIDLYIAQVVPRVRPVEVEESFRISLPEKPYDIIGDIDLLCYWDDVLCVLDWKFRSKKKEIHVSASEWPQGTIYAEYLWRTRGLSLPLVKLEMWRNKRTPGWDFRTGQRGPRDFADLLEVADGVARNIDRDIFPANGLGQPLCDKRWCDFWGICEARIADSERRMF